MRHPLCSHDTVPGIAKLYGGMTGSMSILREKIHYVLIFSCLVHLVAGSLLASSPLTTNPHVVSFVAGYRSSGMGIAS